MSRKHHIIIKNEDKEKVLNELMNNKRECSVSNNLELTTIIFNEDIDTDFELGGKLSKYIIECKMV